MPAAYADAFVCEVPHHLAIHTIPQMNNFTDKSSQDTDSSNYIPEDNRHTHTQQTPPELADRYTFIEQLGHGAQGTVYLAIRNADGLKVAIKRLNIDSVQNWKEYDLFRREAEVLKTIDIPGVAHFYEAPEFLDIPNPAAYIVQEYIEGQSVEQMIQSGFRFTLPRLFHFTVRLLSILEQLHSHVPPIIHRDIKPANILMKIGPEGYTPYLIDFGAVANPQVQTGGSTVAGTYGYMPPEQLMGRPVPASDIYSLAAMLAYMMSGVEPANMQVTDFHLIIEPHLENIPNIVTATLHQMLDPNAETRLYDIKQLKERFEMFASDKFELSLGKKNELNEAALNNVLTLGQRGNIDLWMSLPDDVPRKVPMLYSNLEPTIPIATESVFPQLAKTFTGIAIAAVPRSIPGRVLLIISIFLFIIARLAADDDPFASNNVSFAFYIFSGWSLFLSLVVYFSAFYNIYKNKKLFLSCPQMTIPSVYPNKDVYINDILLLLSKGSKSIATVVSYDYMPVPYDEMEIYQLGFMDESKFNEFKAASSNVYVHTYPRFKIRYKFNPADDDNPYDLVHTIFVHKDMSSTLKVGDPIPILYYINPNDNLDVMSMPFPYPLRDVANPKELYFKNENKNIQQMHFNKG